MLDINASYHCVQFQGKLMNQTWENDQKSSFGPNFGSFIFKNLAQEFIQAVLLMSVFWTKIEFSKVVKCWWGSVCCKLHNGLIAES